MDTLNGARIGLTIIGIVDLVKQLVNTEDKQPIKGRVTILVALGVGGVLYGLSAAIQYNLLNEATQMWVCLGADWLSMMLAIPGLFNIIVNKILQ